MGVRTAGVLPEAAAEVLAANGITVYLFDGPRPTPELSFAVRAYGCLAGINITASHNPKEYNGYKAYWCDGAQLQTETAMAVSARLEEIDVFAGPKRMDLQRGIELGRICLLGRSCDEAYLKAVEELSTVWPGMEADKEKVKIVYTPLHGCGYQLVPEILCRTGLQRLLCEPSPNGVGWGFFYSGIAQSGISGELCPGSRTCHQRKRGPDFGNRPGL